jgi:hypothetical protein
MGRPSLRPKSPEVKRRMEGSAFHSIKIDHPVRSPWDRCVIDQVEEDLHN